MFNALLESQRAAVTVFVFFAVFLVAIAIGRLLKRRAAVRFGAAFKLFCLTLASYAALVVYGADTSWRGHVGAGLVLLSTTVVVALLNRYLWDYYYGTQRNVVIPRLLRDFVAVILFVIALFLVLSIGYRAQGELKGLLAGSGVAAIILGFGMQNLLSTLVAGAELQLGRPYKVGDWLKIGEHIGQVTEINWADTILRTNDAISMEIPNNKIVEETIVNLSSPTPLHAMRITVGADYGVAPNRVKDALCRAASNAEGLIHDPAPKAYLKDFGDSAIVYEVRFWMTTHAGFSEICDAIRTNIWYEFKRQKINIPFPIRTLQIDQKNEQALVKEVNTARAVLRREPLFQCLREEQIDALVENSDIKYFGRGEAVVEEGAEGESMFILLEGSAEVSVAKDGALIRVGVLRAGDCFGEMSLLTGAPRTATVRAEKDCEVLEVSKPVVGELLRTAPECLHQLSELLAKRRLETEGIVRESAKPAEHGEKQREYTATFLRRLRSFFEL